MLYKTTTTSTTQQPAYGEKNPAPDNPPLTEKLPDTKGIHPQNQKKPNMSLPQPCRRGKKNGTDFRHAVEFSRSRRTPVWIFRSVSGQLALRYSADFAESNRSLIACPPSIPLNRG